MSIEPVLDQFYPRGLDQHVGDSTIWATGDCRTWCRAHIMPLFTILLPITRQPFFLPYAVASVLAQTVEAFELFIVGDGAPSETIDCAQDFAQRDPRVKVFAFPKGPRNGEAHWHHVLGKASGRYVAHIEDDDLWFPNHLAELEKLLLTADFGHTIHVWGHPDGRVEPLPSDIGIPEFRQLFLNKKFNRIGFSVCGYRLDAYRRLPEGWAPSPEGFWPDLHMWRKFLSRAEFTFGTRMAITAIVLPTHLWGTIATDDRARETQNWLERIRNEQEGTKIVDAAWRFIVRESIHQEQHIIDFTTLLDRMTASRDQIQSELALMTASRDQLQAELGGMSASRDQLQVELGGMTSLRDQLQVELEGMTASRNEMRAERNRIVQSRSWRLTKPLRAVLMLATRAGRALRRHPD